MDNVSSKDKNEKIYREYKTDDLFDNDNVDDIQKKNESADPETGQTKTADSLADSNSCHGKYLDIFDDEKEGNEFDEDQPDNNGVLNCDNEKDDDVEDEGGENENASDAEETDEEVRIKKIKGHKGKKEKVCYL